MMTRFKDTLMFKVLLLVTVLCLATPLSTYETCLFCNYKVSEKYLDCIIYGMKRNYNFRNVSESEMEDMRMSLLAASEAMRMKGSTKEKAMREVLIIEMVALIDPDVNYERKITEIKNICGRCYYYINKVPDKDYAIQQSVPENKITSKPEQSGDQQQSDDVSQFGDSDTNTNVNGFNQNQEMNQGYRSPSPRNPLPYQNAPQEQATDASANANSFYQNQKTNQDYKILLAKKRPIQKQESASNDNANGFNPIQQQGQRGPSIGQGDANALEYSDSYSETSLMDTQKNQALYNPQYSNQRNQNVYPNSYQSYPLNGAQNPNYQEKRFNRIYQQNNQPDMQKFGYIPQNQNLNSYNRKYSKSKFPEIESGNTDANAAAVAYANNGPQNNDGQFSNGDSIEPAQEFSPNQNSYAFNSNKPASSASASSSITNDGGDDSDISQNAKSKEQSNTNQQNIPVTKNHKTTNAIIFSEYLFMELHTDEAPFNKLFHTKTTKDQALFLIPSMCYNGFISCGYSKETAQKIARKSIPAIYKLPKGLSTQSYAEAVCKTIMETLFSDEMIGDTPDAQAKYLGKAMLKYLEGIPPTLQDNNNTPGVSPTRQQDDKDDVGDINTGDDDFDDDDDNDGFDDGNDDNFDDDEGEDDFDDDEGEDDLDDDEGEDDFDDDEGEDGFDEDNDNDDFDEDDNGDFDGDNGDDDGDAIDDGGDNQNSKYNFNKFDDVDGAIRPNKYFRFKNRKDRYKKNKNTKYVDDAPILYDGDDNSNLKGKRKQKQDEKKLKPQYDRKNDNRYNKKLDDISNTSQQPPKQHFFSNANDQKSFKSFDNGQIINNFLQKSDEQRNSGDDVAVIQPDLSDGDENSKQEINKSAANEDESRERIKVLRQKVLDCIEDGNFNYQMLGSSIATFAKNVGKTHPGWGAQKSLTRVLIEVIVAMAEILKRTNCDNPSGINQQPMQVPVSEQLPSNFQEQSDKQNYQNEPQDNMSVDYGRVETNPEPIVQQEPAYQPATDYPGTENREILDDRLINDYGISQNSPAMQQAPLSQAEPVLTNPVPQQAISSIPQNEAQDSYWTANLAFQNNPNPFFRINNNNANSQFALQPSLQEQPNSNQVSSFQTANSNPGVPNINTMQNQFNDQYNWDSSPQIDTSNPNSIQYVNQGSPQYFQQNSANIPNLAQMGTQGNWPPLMQTSQGNLNNLGQVQMQDSMAPLMQNGQGSLNLGQVQMQDNMGPLIQSGQNGLNLGQNGNWPPSQQNGWNTQFMGNGNQGINPTNQDIGGMVQNENLPQNLPPQNNYQMNQQLWG